MTTCAETLAQTLRDAGVTRIFGFPGGEILPFIEAARQLGIEFILTRDEATASFMADVHGQITRQPGVCVATLGPGAVNLCQGVANAYLDRSPMIAITATTALESAPFVTHQKLDLNAVYRPFTKAAITLDGEDTAVKVRQVYRTSIEPRMGPVHLALPSDVGTRTERESSRPTALSLVVEAPPAPEHDKVERVRSIMRSSERPVVILGLDLNPLDDVPAVRAFVEALGAPVFVTPKAKGVLPEDHPLFMGVCAGVSGDAVVMEFFGRADLLIGLGFDPVESDKLWHKTMKLISIGPVSIAEDEYTPHAECVGDVRSSLRALAPNGNARPAWSEEEIRRFRQALDVTLRPGREATRGLSPYEVTVALRDAFPRNTILCTDVGSIKSVTTQGWKSYEPLSFFESNGLSSMGYGFPAAMAARRLFPDRPILCTIGDGGFGMTLSELETCARERLDFVTVVYNDSALSLIQVAQERRRYPNHGVEFTKVDFALVAEAFGVWSRKVDSMDQLAEAMREASALRAPAVIDVTIDPTEYRAHEGIGYTPLLATAKTDESA